MNANDKMNAKIESQTTEALLEIATRMILVCTNEAIIVGIRVERELERRLSAADFAAHIDAMEAMLDAAA